MTKISVMNVCFQGESAIQSAIRERVVIFLSRMKQETMIVLNLILAYGLAFSNVTGKITFGTIVFLCSI
jgi:hypothetical protein